MRELRLVDTTAEALVLAAVTSPADPAPAPEGMDVAADFAADSPDETAWDEHFILPLTPEVATALQSLLTDNAQDSEQDDTDAAAAADVADEVAADSEDADDTDDLVAQEVAPTPVVEVAAPAPVEFTPDTPRVHLSPKEIQHRIRAGASVADLVRETGMTEARIDVFAHPIFQERQHIARLAHQAHPLGQHGPVRETLYEVLAVAFAGRGWRLNQAQWDAYRPGTSSRWMVSLTWPTGHTEATAVWAYDSDGLGSATVTPTNELAADLVDPGLNQPVRTLSPVARGTALFDVEAEDDEDFGTPLERPEGRHATVSSLPHAQPSPAAPGTGELPGEEDFLQHPEPQRKNKRRKPIPGWEDVLLGVRGTKK